MRSYSTRLVKSADLLCSSVSKVAKLQTNPDLADLILYHGSGCPDGYASAFAAWLRRGDFATYIPMEHGPSLVIPEVTGKHVVVVDFSFSAAVTADLKSKAASFVVLDHHASAEKELIDLPEENKIFEMKQSGATLAWDYFHKTEPPLFFRYLEDKDIWRWALCDSEAFSAGFGTIKFEMGAFKTLLDKSEAGVDEIIGRGRAILEYKNGVRDSHVKRAVPCRLKAAPQFDGLVVNGSTIASEIGNAMCQQPGIQFGAIWSYDHSKKSIYVSLRSDSDDVDVSIIAKSFGGGGHKRAAGFSYSGSSIEDLLLPPRESSADEVNAKRTRIE
jgi:hypothetical protein